MKKKLQKISDIEKEIFLETERNKCKGLHFGKENLLLTLSLKENDWRLRILIHSKQNLLNGGIYIEERNCFYPKDLTNYKNIAESNKLEKLFKKWGFRSL